METKKKTTKKVERKFSAPLDQFSDEVLEKYVGNIERFKDLFEKLTTQNVGALRDEFFNLYNEVNSKLICYRDRDGNLIDRDHPHVRFIDKLKASGQTKFQFADNYYDKRREELGLDEPIMMSGCGGSGWAVEDELKITTLVNDIEEIKSAIDQLYWEYENTKLGKIKCFFLKLFKKYVEKEEMLKEHLDWAYDAVGLSEEEDLINE